MALFSPRQSRVEKDTSSEDSLYYTLSALIYQYSRYNVKLPSLERELCGYSELHISYHTIFVVKLVFVDNSLLDDRCAGNFVGTIKFHNANALSSAT